MFGGGGKGLDNHHLFFSGSVQYSEFIKTTLWQSHRVMSRILLMWFFSFRVNMGVGALYCQYYVDVRQRCCYYYYYYYYKNKYSFVWSYEVVSWSVWKVCSQPLWLNKLQFKCARQKQAVVPCKCGSKWIAVIVLISFQTVFIWLLFNGDRVC